VLPFSLSLHLGIIGVHGFQMRKGTERIES
jgi:hypothetical protein